MFHIWFYAWCLPGLGSGAFSTGVLLWGLTPCQLRCFVCALNGRGEVGGQNSLVALCPLWIAGIMQLLI